MHKSSPLNDVSTTEWQKIIGKITHKLASKFGYQDIDDINQEAWIILHHAAKKFDPNRGVKFTTYASTCIFRHLIKCLKHNNRPEIQVDEEFDIVDNHNDDSELRQKVLDLMSDEPLLKSYFIDKKTYEQIAKETNQYPGSAYKEVKSAIKRLGAKLSEDDSNY